MSSPMPRARVLSTGSEITQGLYPDTNAQRLSQFLFEAGFRVVGHAASPDDPVEIRRAIISAAEGCDLLVISGGLGPTDDDLNRDLVAEVYGAPLKKDGQAERMMRDRFAARNRPMPERNVVQAMLPVGSTPLYNHWGTAPGFVLPARAVRGRSLPRLFALPGPSSEWQPMIRAAADENLLFPDRTAPVVRLVHTLNIFTVPESTINHLLAGIPFSGNHTEITILAHRGQIRLRLIATAGDETTAREQLAGLRSRVVERIGERFIAGEGADALGPARVVFDHLRLRGQTIATAESCTGGWVAKSLTDIAGSSECFQAGWVTYSNQAKTRELGVPAALIERHGAVSAEVVLAMAEGARVRAGANFGLSVSGIAGPGGGSEEKPVGTVWFGMAAEGRAEARHARFPGDRDAVREWSVTQALEYFRRFHLGLDLDMHNLL